MQFLKTLFWVLLAVLVALFSSRNWSAVTLNLWGDIEADIKLPLLLAILFLLGFLPTWIVMRTKVWALRRRLEGIDRSQPSDTTMHPPIGAEPAPPPVFEDGEAR